MSKHDSITRSAAGPNGTAPPSGSAPLSASTPTRSASSSSTSLAATQTVVAPADVNLQRIRWAVGVTLAVLALLLAGRLALIDGLWRTARIEGPSMAPSSLGDHYRVTCEDCRFVFRCDALDPPSNRQAACPNCGFPTNDLREEDLVRGQRVVVDRGPLLIRQPRSGEVVAAADPTAPGEMVIKRVAAVPGQKLTIRGGDLYHGTRLVRKTWQELTQVRVLVHDNNFQPEQTPGIPARWQGVGATLWHAALRGFRREAGSDAMEWLEYQHHQMFGLSARTRHSSILDLDSFNPSATRLLNTVSDVMLSCHLRAEGEGRFALAATDGPHRFQATIDPHTREVVLTDRDRELLKQPLGHRFERRGVAVEFGLCDQQVFLRVGGREVIRHPYDRESGGSETAHPLAIGTQGLALYVDSLRVWRDIYYLAPDGTSRKWTAADPPGNGQVVLLGDNASVSIDSRQWESSPKLSQVYGVVRRPFWAAGDAL
jgi:hypothetical protein